MHFSPNLILEDIYNLPMGTVRISLLCLHLLILKSKDLFPRHSKMNMQMMNHLYKYYLCN